ncbi:protein Mdm4-like [Corticium candelabrum]|uniref:protein Mdm4-like n=1 Tax=Corticium candelabrum TaxID=121492 RepID=UPI002E25E8B5|nr:protein Mdm4-like [Corticium candelabrum]
MTTTGVNECREHPYHHHPLVQMDAFSVYANTNGIWECAVCRTSSSESHERYLYRCQACSFNLCNKCFSVVGGLHSLHSHSLKKSLVRDVFEGGVWHCNRCNVMNSGEWSYHCSLCDFDLCETCFHSQPHPLHEHPLLQADARVVYPQSDARWCCDHCRKQFDSNIFHYCPKCQFNLCVKCVAGQQHHLHLHKLWLANSKVVYSSSLWNGWFCNNCKRSSHGVTSLYMWHCRVCKFDLCMSCYSLPPPRPSPPRPTGGNGLRYPVQEQSIQPRLDGANHTECVVCKDKPMNASIIHGDGTSHVEFCVDCARTLKDKQQRCPLCRKTIDKVEKQFDS